MRERKEEQQLLMKQLLSDANIPALSLGWYQKEKDRLAVLAYGQADTLTLSPVDTKTLFQAASLSKPVSAAIVLDLVAHPDGPLVSIPPFPDDGRGVLAGSMLTNVEDYIVFLQYVFLSVSRC